MPESLIIEHCSPTLAGIKTGNLFSCLYQSRQEVTLQVRELNRKLKPKGLLLLPLKYMHRRVLLYLYRPAMLDRDLKDPERIRILKECGYEDCQGEHCIRTLIRHLSRNSVFPHEIGLFLSFPPEDVDGFIRNKGEHFKYSGVWKVYGDVDRSMRLFEQYKQCTNVYCRRNRDGMSLQNLAVDISV